MIPRALLQEFLQMYLDDIWIIVTLRNLRINEGQMCKYEKLNRKHFLFITYDNYIYIEHLLTINSNIRGKVYLDLLGIVSFLSLRI
jgi:hypothetical protein